jgi:type VI secretion system secreted protein VgrG
MAGPVTVTTPLGPDALAFQSMDGREALGELFEYSVYLSSEDPNVMLTDLLGQTISVTLQLPEGKERNVHGYVTAFEFVAHGRPAALYKATVRPWLWLLTQTTDCRIFQNQSIPDIVKQVFRDNDFEDFEDCLSGEYSAKEYIVQYRESDFNFVSRLLEETGIYYYFRHTADAHTLVLADSYAAHEATSGYETLPYYPPDDHRSALEEYVDDWRLVQSITPGSVALRDFDFERPRANLTALTSSSKDYVHSDFEVYDYPGDYLVRSHGEDLARLRLEQRQKTFERADGRTNARGLVVGALFSLTEHPRDDQNREYLVTFARVALRGHELQSGDSSDSPIFTGEFTVIPSTVPYRTTPRAKKPVMDGPQTATVVGAAGEEIWTDKYGRVKLQFHWDREGASDENSSCWVRVSQAWAGSNWGSIHLPRIGQEVIVDFLEGDPDRPIVTGRVYNANNMVPYALPGNQTRSGIKSRSTKGGAVPNANEIRFEDRKGSEEFFIQAEKDLNSVVKNNETASVGADRSRTVGANDTLSVGKNRKADVGVNETITIGADESLTVGGNETIAVTGNDTVSIGGDETLSVGGNQSASVAGNDSTTVGGNQTLLVAGNRSETVAAAEEITVGGARAVTVGGAQAVTIGGSLAENVGGSVSIHVGGKRSEAVGSDESVSIAGGQTVTVGKKGALKITQQLVIDAGEEIVLKAGEASITLKKNGDIVLKGKNLSSDASGKVSVKAASDLVLKGSKISHN